MKVLAAIFGLFGRSSNKPPKRKYIETTPDVKFSALIHSIQHDMVAANESMQGIGLKYIEKFFDTPIEPVLDKSLSEQLETIEQLLDAEDIEASQTMVKSLKDDLKAQQVLSKNRHYRPKMTTFDVPVHSNGKWHYQKLDVPLIALAPLPFPKIKECVFTSRLDSISQHENELVVSIQPTRQNTNKQHSDSSDTELKILISPEQTSAELDQVVEHYQQLLSSSKPN